MEPRVHHNKEVTLKLTVEASNVASYVKNTSGPDQPVIGTRTITSTIRLKDGETNVLAGLIRKDTSTTKSSIPFLGDLPLIGTLFSNVRDENNRTDLLLTLTPRIVRQPQITEEDLVPIWVGTENNVSFSGLSTRLESPNAPGSPFDAGGEAGGRGSSPTRAVPGAQGSGTAPPASLFQQGSGPSDAFRRPTPPPAPSAPSAPSTTVPRGSANTAGGDESAAAVPAAASTPAAPVLLTLRSDASSLAVGGTATVTLEGLSGLSELNAMELNLEWDPAVVEVSAIAAGPWQDQSAPGTFRFDAQRVPGSVRLQMNRNGAAIGLPGGELARLTVKAVGPGDTSIRLSTGSALGRSGGSKPAARAALLSVRG
jgi:general secretion pathway protein D